MGKKCDWRPSVTRLHLVVEGQSEERFVKDRLAPHLWFKAIDVRVSVVKTSRDRSGFAARGGGDVQKFLGDIRGVLNNPGNHYVSSIFDFYGFPDPVVKSGI